ncbi:ATP-dependent DNA helicase [Nafulsella turpanensis]|uniref:ATP-dependent DNA helicase n=1 Tax=Nafulsella turpanensis TaxID=1265690 RepID=UPI0003499943|nr:AAA family ATPase [Nafulsella turpanensis]
MPLFSQIILKKFPFQPTSGQSRFFNLLDSFIKAPEGSRQALLLRGYAGTGKTTVVSALVQTLPLFNYRFALMAPTGRAAKVMSSYTGKAAYTIHKIIYRQAGEPGGGDDLLFDLQKNYFKNTIFIIDEASMLSDVAEVGHNGLLKDLIDFVYAHENNKLLLIGDSAQLPPVHQQQSPALDINYLQRHLRLQVQEVEFTEVMRQEHDSGILFNATNLRNELQKEAFSIKFVTRTFKDTYRMTGEKLEDGLRYAYNKFGMENAIIITRSNKAAVQYNQYIRRVIQYSESEIDAGDYLMIVRNNYTYLPPDSPANFLANGDFVEVMKIVNFEDLYGYRFATLELRLTDYPDVPPFEAKIILDTLHTPQASLSSEDYRKLYEAVKLDYADLSKKKELREALKKDPYLNALQVKFAYALTCHKSQGGQWDAVFVDQGYLTEEMVDREYIRWLYTAITRATKELYLINFNKNFFS